MLNKTSKEAIIGLRRKNQSRTNIGGLIYKMWSEKVPKIFGVKRVCEMLKTDPRVLKKHFGFRIYPQGHKEDYIIHLSDEDMDVIKKTVEIFGEVSKLDPEKQKIVQYVFFYLVKKNG